MFEVVDARRIYNLLHAVAHDLHYLLFKLLGNGGVGAVEADGQCGARGDDGDLGNFTGEVDAAVGVLPRLRVPLEAVVHAAAATFQFGGQRAAGEHRGVRVGCIVVRVEHLLVVVTVMVMSGTRSWAGSGTSHILCDTKLSGIRKISSARRLGWLIFSF